MSRRKVAIEEPAQKLSNEQIYAALAALPDDKVEALMDALYTRATGCYITTRFRKVGQSAQGQECMTLVASDCPYCKEKGPLEEGNLYKILPDINALRLFVEYNAGRPATRQAPKTDPVITIKHCIPGKREWAKDVLTKSPVIEADVDEEAPVPVSLQEPDMGWEPKGDQWPSTG